MRQIVSAHKDAFRRLCSRRLSENMAAKEEIAQNDQFLLLRLCFQTLFNSETFIYRGFPYLTQIVSKASAADLLYVGKG